MFEVIKQANGLFGVVDRSRQVTVVDDDGREERIDEQVLFSAKESDAVAWADRLNLRRAWGV